MDGWRSVRNLLEGEFARLILVAAREIFPLPHGADVGIGPRTSGVRPTRRVSGADTQKKKRQKKKG